MATAVSPGPCHLRLDGLARSNTPISLDRDLEKGFRLNCQHEKQVDPDIGRRQIPIVIRDNTKVSLYVGLVDRPMAQPVQVTEANRAVGCVDPEATIVLPVAKLCRREQRSKQSFGAGCSASTRRLRSRVLQDAVALRRSARRGRDTSATPVRPCR